MFREVVLPVLNEPDYPLLNKLGELLLLFVVFWLFLFFLPFVDGDSLADEDTTSEFCARLPQLIYFIMLTYHKFQVMKVVDENFVMDVQMPGFRQSSGELLGDGSEGGEVFSGDGGDGQLHNVEQWLFGGKHVPWGCPQLDYALQLVEAVSGDSVEGGGDHGGRIHLIIYVTIMYYLIWT